MPLDPCSRYPGGAGPGWQPQPPNPPAMPPLPPPPPDPPPPLPPLINPSAAQAPGEEHRHHAIRASSPARQEGGYKPRTRSFRDGVEQRLRARVGEDTEMDAAGSGNGGIAYSRPESRWSKELVGYPVMGQSARASSSGTQSMPQHKTIQLVLADAPMPAPENISSLGIACGIRQAHTGVESTFQIQGMPRRMGILPLSGMQTIAAKVQGKGSMASQAVYTRGLELHSQQGAGGLGVLAPQAAMM